MNLLLLSQSFKKRFLIDFNLKKEIDIVYKHLKFHNIPFSSHSTHGN